LLELRRGFINRKIVMEQNNDKLFELMKALSESGVKFVVCGGVACVLQGVERATFDLDIYADLETGNLKSLIEVTKQFNLIPRIPEPVENLLDEKKRESWIQTKDALVYTFVSNSGPLQIDIFLKYPKSYDELLWNADEIEIDDVKIYVSSIEDLIFAKKLVNPVRDKDLTDIKELEEKLRNK